MESIGQIPAWNECHFNIERNRGILGQLDKSTMVFPDEFYPHEASSWKGVPFKKWHDYVMGKKN